MVQPESTAAVSRLKKKFPWLLLGAGAVATGIVVYLLLGKKANPGNKVLTVNGVRFEMVSIPAGKFQMGSNNGDYDERPEHTVRLSKHFWMGKTEVTQGLWKAVMGDNPAHFQKGDNYPVEMVSWNACQVFIARLNQWVGENRFRLPTEAEWEYACRAGTTGDYYGAIDAIAWYVENSDGSTQAVGQKQANAFGLHDMLGNVCEQCQDWYGLYSNGYQTDPSGPPSGWLRTARGGSWNLIASCVRASIRRWVDPNGYNYILGLRLAASSTGGW